MSVSKATICLGANTPDAADRLAAAYGSLKVLGAIVRATPPYLTAPEHAGEAAPYLNQIVVLATHLSLDELTARTKRYQGVTRSHNPYAPLVNIDIDIVYWNDTIVRAADARAAYFLQGLGML